MTDPAQRDWTPSQVMTHVLAMLEAERRRVDQEFRSLAQAVRIAVDALDRRLEGMNEFRATLSDQSSRMMTRNEVDARFNSVEEKIELARIERTRQLAAMEDEIKDIRARIDAGGGKSAGLSAAWAVVIGVVALIGTIAGTAMSFKMLTGGK